MAGENQSFQDPINDLLSDFGTRLNEIEEKQRLLKDRMLLIGENLISTKEDFDKQELDLKKKIKELELEIQALKQLNKRIIYELENSARKSELEILQRQLKMFEPLEFARIKDVKSIVEKEIKKLQEQKKSKKEPKTK